MLVNESDLDKKDKNISNKRRNKTSVTKVESKTEQDKIVKNQTYVLSLLLVKVTLSLVKNNFS